MTLRRFLDCGYALLVEAHNGLPNVDLLTAIDRVNDSIYIQDEKPVRVSEAQQNEASLAQLEDMMKGVGGFR